ncbi:MAG: YiaA/YiaB family inner membrane protein, partial [Trueperaceae bacterium]
MCEPILTKTLKCIYWWTLLLGAAGYLIGLWNSDMGLREKGFYFTLFMYGLFS